MKDLLLENLSKYFGYDEFRLPQEEIIESILSGKNTLAIMPTGGGKSLCYQLPALIMKGITIVVSPLIALMKDQVDSLQQRGISAAMINSSQTWAQQLEVLNDLKNGNIKIAYIAPERFRANSFIDALKNIKISLLAVDEAHCISQWGHDFRPDYMRLGEVLKFLGNPLCAAFTATATPEVRQDIIKELNIDTSSIFVSGFARDNLSINVSIFEKKVEKYLRLRSIIDKYEKGIIYCATRKSVEALSELFWQDGIRHIIYHGAMSTSARDDAQEKFISSKEDIAIATNAFGMGIDRSDIRFVCHYEITGSVEAYYQEAGRAGRDGLPAHCELLMMYSDKRVQEFFIEGSNPDLDYIRKTYDTIKLSSNSQGETLISIEDIADIVSDTYLKRTSSNSMAASSAISILRKGGYIERYDVVGSRVRGTKILDRNLSSRDINFPFGYLEAKKQRDLNKLSSMINFAYTKECRQGWILKYFGELHSSRCQKCDNCSVMISMTFAHLNPEQTIIVRKALSAIARLSIKVSKREWKARFGKDRVLKHLIGSKEEKITAFGLDKIQTFAILKDYGKDFVSKLLNALVEASYVNIIQGQYPLMELTSSGVDLMLGNLENAKMNFPEISSTNTKKKTSRPTKISSAQVSLTKDEDELYMKLAQYRVKLARARGSKPLYVIFPNEVLHNLAKIKPSTIEEAMQIKGISEVKANTILSGFMKIIAEYSPTQK